MLAVVVCDDGQKCNKVQTKHANTTSHYRTARSAAGRRKWLRAFTFEMLSRQMWCVNRSKPVKYCKARLSPGHHSAADRRSGEYRLSAKASNDWLKRLLQATYEKEPESAKATPELVC